MPVIWTPHKKRQAEEAIKLSGSPEAAASLLRRKWRIPITDQDMGIFVDQQVEEVGSFQEAAAPTAWQTYRPRPGYAFPVSGKPSKVTKDVVTRVVVIPDSHHPLVNKDAWRVAVDVVREFKPHVGIIIGDFMDMESLSSHPRNAPDAVRLAEEYYATNIALDELQDAAPTADWTYIEGNHEERARRFVNEHGTMEGMFDVPVSLYMRGKSQLYRREAKVELRGMRWVSLEEQPYMTSHSAYYHGHHCMAMHHAAWHANVYCPARTQGKPLFYGHMHSFQSFTSANGSEAHCTGYLGDQAAMKYTKGRPTPWAHGIMLQEIAPDGSMSHAPIPIKSGKAVFYGRTVSVRV